MHRGKQLIGLPVVDVATGQSLATVRSLLFRSGTGELLALVLQKAGWLTEGKAIHPGQLQAIGSDALLLAPGEQPVSLAAFMDLHPDAVSENEMLGHSVLTAEGRLLGTLVDLVLEQDSGQIVQYVLSDGIVQDLIGGYYTIPAPQHAVYGDENIIVPETVC